MYMPKTIKGYFKLLKQLDRLEPWLMKGYDGLPKDVKDEIAGFDVDVSNNLGVLQDAINANQ